MARAFYREKIAHGEAHGTAHGTFPGDKRGGEHGEGYGESHGEDYGDQTSLSDASILPKIQSKAQVRGF